MLTGARSLIAISEWITDAPQHALGVLGFAADPLTGLRPVPYAATVRRLLHRVDGDALDAAISAYLQARTPPPAEPEAKGPVRQVIAVDGKVARGSRTKTATAIQLLAATDHHGVVLTQRQVASKSNEIPSFAPLLSGLNLQNSVVTADALHTQHHHGAHLIGHGAYLIGRGAHYVAVVKKNHPGLCAQVRKLPWRDIPLGHRTRDHAHHRDEIRRLKVAASRTSCTTCGTARSARTTPRSAPAPCPVPWPPCATAPSASSARTVRPTSPPPSAAPAATTAAPCKPSASRDEPGQISITQ
ncbi:ISAs1 family transposase [Streptomyces sp. S1D4-11]|nr:ISAs1 family transposase [Streptomyces sp. S1D4-11]